MASSSSRTRSRSPFSHRRPPSPYSSASSTSSSHINNRLLPRSSSTPTSTVYNSGGVSGSRSMSITRTISDSGPIGGSGTYGAQSSAPYSSEGLIGESVPTITSERDSISVTVRFRPMSEREYQRGDEIVWYPDADKMVRNEYNPLTAYAFDKVFGPQATTTEVYDVAARPVVNAAMEGVNGTVFAYGVTSSGKTHTMHFNAKLFNRQRRIKDKNIDVILDDRDERNAEEWFVDPSERDGESNSQPVYQGSNDEPREDLESDEEHDIANDIEFESDTEEVVNVDGLGGEEV